MIAIGEESSDLSKECRSTREQSPLLDRETLEKLRRCNVPPPELPEHDLEDKDDPSACVEYATDMYKHFKELEVSLRSKF